MSQLVYGDLGARSNTYVTVEGIAVTDGANVRAEIGHLGSGEYGLRVISSDGSTVIIDATSNMFKIQASGTLTATAGPISTATSSVDTGIAASVQPAFLAYLTLDEATPTEIRTLGWGSTRIQAYAAATSGGATTQSIRAIAHMAEVRSWIATGTVRMSLLVQNSQAAGDITYDAKWYLLREAAL